MRRNRWFTGIAILGLLLLITVGCSKNPAESSDNELENSLKAVVEENADYFTADGLNDDGAQPINYSTDGLLKPLMPIDPIRFGRKGRFQLESLNITRNEDGLLEAVVVHSFNGRFFVLAVDSLNPNAVGTLYEKDMKNTITRRAIFRRMGRSKQGRTKHHRMNWKLKCISGSELVSEQTSIMIDQVKIMATNDSSWTITDPLNFSMNIDDIPTFQPGDSVKVYVTLQNRNVYSEKPGEIVLLRYRNNRGMHRARKAFHDDGVYPDETAGDGIYSGMWAIGHRRGVFHAFVDVIDNGTLYDDTAPYDSRAWGIPYRVHFR